MCSTVALLYYFKSASFQLASSRNLYSNGIFVEIFINAVAKFSEMVIRFHVTVELSIERIVLNCWSGIFATNSVNLIIIIIKNFAKRCAVFIKLFHIK